MPRPLAKVLRFFLLACGALGFLGVCLACWRLLRLAGAGLWQVNESLLVAYSLGIAGGIIVVALAWATRRTLRQLLTWRVPSAAGKALLGLWILLAIGFLAMRTPRIQRYMSKELYDNAVGDEYAEDTVRQFSVHEPMEVPCGDD